jgi:transposase
MAWRALSDAQWERIRPHLSREKTGPQGDRLRADLRRCFEGILWVLWTGAPWSELPPRYGSPTNCWRRLRQWEDSGVLLALWRAFLNERNDRQKIRWNECFVDGSFAPAKKGAPTSVPPRAARAQSGWYWSMARVLR